MTALLFSLFISGWIIGSDAQACGEHLIDLPRQATFATESPLALKGTMLEKLKILRNPPAGTTKADIQKLSQEVFDLLFQIERRGLFAVLEVALLFWPREINLENRESYKFLNWQDFPPVVREIFQTEFLISLFYVLQDKSVLEELWTKHERLAVKFLESIGHFERDLRILSRLLKVNLVEELANAVLEMLWMGQKKMKKSEIQDVLVKLLRLKTKAGSDFVSVQAAQGLSPSLKRICMNLVRNSTTAVFIDTESIEAVLAMATEQSLPRWKKFYYYVVRELRPIIRPIEISQMLTGNIAVATAIEYTRMEMDRSLPIEIDMIRILGSRGAGAEDSLDTLTFMAEAHPNVLIRNAANDAIVRITEGSSETEEYFRFPSK